MLVGCYKVDIYWTDHPEQARVTLITDWSARSEGVNVPQSYTVNLLEPPTTMTFT